MKETIGSLLEAFVVVIILGISVPVLFHYFMVWNDYWNNSSTVEIQMSEGLATSSISDYDALSSATSDCSARAQKYFGTSNVLSYASSTGDETYQKYDCYGVKTAKLPASTK